MNLTAHDFPRFYRAVNGYDPFPWQRRLVETVAAHGGRWPEVLDLPTSAGKTSALDAAVFLLALEVDNGKPKPVHDRAAAVRTFFVVDRRIVVDEAGEKARKLAHLLDQPPANADAIVNAVAKRLRAFGGEVALHVSVLRGGMYQDGSWAESPTQPTICLSTVDQVGSRLLFRGYGVSPYQRAVHAGLVGNDCLILLDEVHLSRPFLETLRAIEFYRSDRWAEQPVRTPFQVVVMSATAGLAAEPVVPPAVPLPPPIRLDAEDEANPLLAARLKANKMARLEDTKGGDEDEGTNRQAFANKVADLARELAGLAGGGRGKLFAAEPVAVIGVVVNRVDTARRVFELLEPGGEVTGYDTVLLTGRVRPYDRDRLLHEWLPRMEARQGRPAAPRGKLFVVATQTVEVGANLSFDALVSEAAPLDALRQRFGRLDRLGSRGESHAVIVARKDLLKAEDRVYGDAVKSTWDWLGKNLYGTGRNKRIDFGIEALAAKLPLDLTPLCARTDLAPVMLPAHVDDWVQTTIPPEPDPDVALFLHGPPSGPADVSVVWRADLNEKVLKDADLARQVVSLVPPMSMEALPVPIWEVRRWLQNASSANPSDLEGEEEEPERRSDAGRGRPVLRWFGPGPDDGTEVLVDLTDIRPGDTLVVPSSYGGCDSFGWCPGSKEAVTDIADDCSWRSKRRPVLRIHRDLPVHSEALTAELANQIQTLRRVIDPATGELDWEDLGNILRDAAPPFEWLRPRNSRCIAYPQDAGPGIILVSRKRIAHPGDRNALPEEAPAAGDEESFTGVGGYVQLEDHCRNVKKRIEEFNRRLQLAPSWAAVLARVALVHDAGKADPRFQLWLYGGTEVHQAKNGFILIAKSATEARNAAAVDAARRRAGWPKGGRHEALSALLVRDNPLASEGITDPDLLLYLVGSHHGRGRPLWLVTPNERRDGPPDEPLPPIAVSLDGLHLAGPARLCPEAELTPLHAGWVDLFWRLVRRYGYWGLAYLEMLLVLADHQQSECEKEGLS